MTAPCPASSAPTYDLAHFIRDVEALLDRHPSVPMTIKEVSSLLGRLVHDTRWLPAEYRSPIQDSYARYILHRDRTNRFVVLSLVWLPGQSTPIHDHSTWGVMGLVENELEEVGYERLDDGSRENYAELRETKGRMVGAGSVSYVLPPYEEIHRIGNPTNRPSLSLHVYGRDLDEVNVFDPVSKKVSPMRIKYYNPVSSACDFII
jgi:predicted metal-dependent enzyme (double-stranded beta helix superfamily)